MDFIKVLIILTSVLATNYIHSENHIHEHGNIVLPRVEICNDSILSLLLDEVIPQAIKWERDSSEFDFYISISHYDKNWAKSNIDARDKTFLTFDLEKTGHHPFILEDSDSYMVVKGYLCFTTKAFSDLYTCPTGELRQFNYDNTDIRGEPEICSYWRFLVIGDLTNPEFENDTRMRYMESSQYKKMQDLKFPISDLIKNFHCN